jgi:hypothetical protein
MWKTFPYDRDHDGLKDSSLALRMTQALQKNEAEAGDS